MKSKLDSIVIGLVAGLLVPLLSISVFYYSAFTAVSFKFFIKHATEIHVLPKLIGVGAVPNLALFFLFMWRNHLASARGVILATFILAFTVLGMNLFF